MCDFSTHGMALLLQRIIRIANRPSTVTSVAFSSMVKRAPGSSRLLTITPKLRGAPWNLFVVINLRSLVHNLEAWVKKRSSLSEMKPNWLMHIDYLTQPWQQSCICIAFHMEEFWSQYLISISFSSSISFFCKCTSLIIILCLWFLLSVLRYFFDSALIWSNCISKSRQSFSPGRMPLGTPP